MGITLSTTGSLSSFTTFQAIINNSIPYIRAANCVFTADQLESLARLLARAKAAFNSKNNNYPWVNNSQEDWFNRTQLVVPTTSGVQGIYDTSNNNVSGVVPFNDLTPDEKINVGAVYFIVSFLLNYNTPNNGALASINNEIIQFFSDRGGTNPIDGSFIGNLRTALQKVRIANGQPVALECDVLVTFAAPMFLVRGCLQEIRIDNVSGNCNIVGNRPNNFRNVIPAANGTLINGGTYVTRASQADGCVLLVPQAEGFGSINLSNLIGDPRPFRALMSRDYLDDSDFVPSSFSSIDSSEYSSESSSDSEEIRNEQFDYLDPRVIPTFNGRNAINTITNPVLFKGRDEDDGYVHYKTHSIYFGDGYQKGGLYYKNGIKYAPELKGEEYDLIRNGNGDKLKNKKYTEKLKGGSSSSSSSNSSSSGNGTLMPGTILNYCAAILIEIRALRHKLHYTRLRNIIEDAMPSDFEKDEFCA